MNDKRRETLKKAIEALDNAKNLVEDTKGEEEESLENLPDAMKEGDKGTKMQEAIDALGDAVDQIDEATASIDNAISN